MFGVVLRGNCRVFRLLSWSYMPVMGDRRECYWERIEEIARPQISYVSNIEYLKPRIETGRLPAGALPEQQECPLPCPGSEGPVSQPIGVTRNSRECARKSKVRFRSHSWA